jgi:hypothetical protein
MKVVCFYRTAPREWHGGTSHSRWSWTGRFDESPLPAIAGQGRIPRHG